MLLFGFEMRVRFDQRDAGAGRDGHLSGAALTDPAIEIGTESRRDGDRCC